MPTEAVHRAGVRTHARTNSERYRTSGGVSGRIGRRGLIGLAGRVGMWHSGERKREGNEGM